MMVVMRGLAAIRAEYNALLELNPELAGVLTVDFTVGTDGRVSDCTILKNTAGDEILARATCAAIGNWQFTTCKEIEEARREKQRPHMVILLVLAAASITLMALLFSGVAG